MKIFCIRYGNTISKKDLGNIDPSILQRIREEIDQKLTSAPDTYGKPLRKSLKGYRRLRIGNFRVIYKIDKQNVEIVHIGKRPDVYKNFMKKNSMRRP